MEYEALDVLELGTRERIAIALIRRITSALPRKRKRTVEMKQHTIQR